MSRAKPVVLALGHTPPPYHGQSIMHAVLLGSSWTEEFAVIRLNTQYVTSVSHIGRQAASKYTRWLYYLVKYTVLLLLHRPNIVYLPMAVRDEAFLRDAAYVLAAQLLRTPYILHLHGYGLQALKRRGLFWRRIVTWVLRHAKGVFVLSPALRDDASEAGARLFTVPNTVADEGALLSLERTTDGATVTLLFMSNPILAKGILVFLDALCAIDTLGVAVHALIAGSGSPDLVTKRVESLRASFHHCTIGVVGTVSGSAKVELYGLADIAVVPTVYEFEALPLVVLEAMAAGVPVIGSAWRGIVDLIQDNVTGRLVEPGDASSLTSAIIDLVRSASTRKQMGTAARERYRTQYSSQRFVATVIAATHACIDSRQILGTGHRTES